MRSNPKISPLLKHCFLLSKAIGVIDWSHGNLHGEFGPQAYYVPWAEWVRIRDCLMEQVGIPRVDRWMACPFFQLLGVPVIAFEVLESGDEARGSD